MDKELPKQPHQQNVTPLQSQARIPDLGEAKLPPKRAPYPDPDTGEIAAVDQDLDL